MATAGIEDVGSNSRLVEERAQAKEINTDRKADWVPPSRPEWVQKVNEEGSCMDISGVVPLDEDSLLNTAMRNTGLSDFGADDWHEPFQVLIRSIEEEAKLNLIGRLRTRSEILQLLEARLRIEDTYKRHPEIEDEVIKEPIIIIGQARSGTSFLVNLLAANPDNGAVRFCDAMFPCPPLEKAAYDTDPRVAKAHRLITQWLRVTPTLESMHEFGGTVPSECVHLMAMNFMGLQWFAALAQTPTYNAYHDKLDLLPAYRYHARVLKLMQWKNPRKHWVLKAPAHLDANALPAVAQVYPDGCYVWPHRDPVRALASSLSIMGTVQWGRTDYPLMGGSMDFTMDADVAAARLNTAIDLIEAGVMPKARLHNMLYKNLIEDPLGSVTAIYDYFKLDLSAAGLRAMEQYLADNPRNARPSHKVMSTSDRVVVLERRAFKRYQDYFNVPNE